MDPKGGRDDQKQGKFLALMGIKTHNFSIKKKVIYRVSQEEWTKLWEGVPYVKLYQYNPKHLCPKLNGF